MMEFKKVYVTEERMQELQYVCYGDGTPHRMDTRVFRYWASPLRDNPGKCRILRCKHEFLTHLTSEDSEYWKAHVREVHSNRKRGK